MGLDISSIRYHCYLKKSGVSFDRVAMLGRHCYYAISAQDLLKVARQFELPLTPDEANDLLTRNDGYVEPFYHWLGASVVHSFDASDYESATYLWDMNEPLDPKFHGQYDFVFDGGTLEHVFQYTAALREAMNMPKLGGLLLSATPADSYLGHGFYQFSPDLAFEVMSLRNGYKNEGVYLVEERLTPKFYEVLPPGKNRSRVLASSAWPTIMYFLGRKIGDVPPRLTASQPDYSSAWETGTHHERSEHVWKSKIVCALGWIPVRLRNSLLRQGKLVIACLTGSSYRFQKNLKRFDKI